MENSGAPDVKTHPKFFRGWEGDDSQKKNAFLGRTLIFLPI